MQKLIQKELCTCSSRIHKAARAARLILPCNGTNGKALAIVSSLSAQIADAHGGVRSLERERGGTPEHFPLPSRISFKITHSQCLAPLLHRTSKTILKK